jgi:hypothetical protein
MTEVGHHGFVVDAQAMAALLVIYATHEDYRRIVQQEFGTLKTLKGQYIDALKKAYPLPVVKDP